MKDYEDLLPIGKKGGCVIAMFVANEQGVFVEGDLLLSTMG